MLLFIEDKPFSRNEGDLFVPVLVSEPTEDSPDMTRNARDFLLDTGAQAPCVYPENLSYYGIDPSVGPTAGPRTIILGDGTERQCRTRDVTLWLCSNIPYLRDHPYRIDLRDGVVVFGEPAGLPLFGLSAMQDAGIKINVDLQRSVFCVWVPGERFIVDLR